MVIEFKGEFYFLSNFYRTDVKYKRRTFRTSEHAFQWAKTTDKDRAEMIKDALHPSDAKRLGRIAPLRPDWEDIKLDVMREIVEAKFKNRALAARLLATSEHRLVEGNRHGDDFWGAVWRRVGTATDPEMRLWFNSKDEMKLVGHNHLGIILMELRAKLS